MARTGMYGGEQIDDIRGGTVGQITFNASGGRTGAYVTITAPSSSSGGYILPVLGSPGSGGFAQFYMRPQTLPTTQRVIIGVDTTSVNIRWNTDGSLAIYSAAGTLIGTTTTTLTDVTRWYRVGFRTVAVTSGDLITIDGVVEVSGTIATGLNAAIGVGDANAGFYIFDADDFVQDNTAWPDADKVLFLLPTSDNARNGWTGGVGGTTNLFNAVDNVPPIGTATETDSTQIESATNSATDNYDANVQSYSTGGIVSGDTIKAVQAIAVHGEDISTGTKSGAVTVVSNPAQAAETTFTYGNDGGALGTWPSVWITTYGALTLNPSVTLATSPVVRVGKRTATTRVVSCCLLGLYVDYVPAVTALGFPFARKDRRVVPII